jgi:hypothetical protein
MVRVLEMFCQASNFHINNIKSFSIVFWVDRKQKVRLEWTQVFKWIWALDEFIPKLLSTHFGLTLDLTNVNDFLLHNI